MEQHLQRIGSYLTHLVRSRGPHGIHSPFVYALITEVLRDDRTRPEFAAVEQLREELLASDRTIEVNDLGAGSRVLDRPVRQVADIARTALKPPRQARLLFRLARYFNPATVLELGTSFGLTTLYLALGAEEGTVTTVEGCPCTFQIAQHHFERSRLGNIRPVLGSFRTRLPEVLRTMERLDMAFIDGHHEKAATLDLFDQCMTRAHEDSLIILDDIHWSRGMEEAWEEVKARPRVTVTIDLFDMGLVFLRSGQAHQHFRSRY